jgi:sterol desaturase/sphingolipid hydroxylase (fatty acid hydroxylase superfamily)
MRVKGAALLDDPRDRPLLRIALGASAIIPAAVYLYLPGRFSWWLALAYWAVWVFVFLDRVTLMLHCTSHRTLFHRRVSWLNRYVPWVLGPFYGQTPGTYFAHHVAMHHAEDNGLADLSSTMPYRRDSALDWLRYFGRFLAFTIVLLPVYLHRKGRPRLAWRVVGGELGFWAVVGALALANPQATLAVFAIPVLAVRMLMMAGNWGQHAFIDPRDPGNDYRNSVTCIECRYNRRCFNDGYHIVHHLRPRKHWSELPGEFESRRAEYGRHDAVVFRGIDFFGVWVNLMLGRWNALARAFVRLPGAPARTDAEVVAFLKARVAPIGVVRHESLRVFDHPVLERLTHVHPLTPLLLWGPIAVWLMWRSLAVHQLPVLAVASMAMLGLFTWSLAEYTLHRYLFHLRPGGPFRARLQFVIHGVHHADPADRTRLVIPPVPSALAGALFYAAFRLALGPTWVEPFFAFFAVGYLLYDYAHYTSHRFAWKNPVSAALRHHHMRHHHAAADGRWGVSSPLWDRVFSSRR